METALVRAVQSRMVNEMVTASWDETARLWMPASGNQIASQKHESTLIQRSSVRW